MTSIFSLALFLVFLQACALPGPKAVVDPVAVYKEGLAEGKKEIIEQVERELKTKGAYGHVKPYHPIRLPADIRRVWVVDHPNDSGDLVSGHWVFIVARPERWASPSFPLLERPEAASDDRMPLNIPHIEEEKAPAAKAPEGGR